MNMPLITRTIVIRNPQGLHARPAQLLAQLAATFECRVELVGDGVRVDAKSIFNLLTLAAMQGTTLVLEAEGDDAEAAVDAIVRLVEEGFGCEEDEDTNEDPANENPGNVENGEQKGPAKN